MSPFFSLALSLVVCATLPDLRVFAPASDGLRIAPEDSLLDVLDRYALATDQTRTPAGELDAVLAGTATGLLREVELPAAKVQGFVEGLVAAHDLALSASDTPGSFSVLSTSAGPAVTDRDYLEVDVDDLPGLAAHTALLVRVSAPLESAERVPVLLRPVFGPSSSGFTRVDAEAASAGVLRLSGFASEVAELAAFLGVADAAPVARSVPAPGEAVSVSADASLIDLVRTCLAALGAEGCVLEQTTWIMNEDAGLAGDVVVDGPDVRTFLEAALLVNSFAVAELRADPLFLVVRHPGFRLARRSLARPTALAQAAIATPATWVVESLELPTFDVRQLPTTLRPLMMDATMASLVARDGSLRVEGPFGHVAPLAGLLRAMDAAQASPDSSLDLSAVALGRSELFPEPSRPLVIPDAGLELELLCAAYADLRGAPLWISAAARAALGSAPAAPGPLEVPRDEVHAWFDELIAGLDLQLVPRAAGSPLATITARRSPGRPRESTIPVVVDPLSLEALSPFATLEVLVPVRLENVDARRLPTQSRAAFAATAHAAGMVTVGNSSFVIVRGPLGVVRRLVDEVLRQDAAGELSPDAWRALGDELAGD